MLYVKLDDAGNVVAWNIKKTDICNHAFDLNSIQFQSLLSKTLALSESIQSDLSMVRVLEDLIETLVKKSIINITELPPQVQDKLTTRKKMREHGSLKTEDPGLIKI